MGEEKDLPNRQVEPYNLTMLLEEVDTRDVAAERETFDEFTARHGMSAQAVDANLKIAEVACNELDQLGAFEGYEDRGAAARAYTHIRLTRWFSGRTASFAGMRKRFEDWPEEVVFDTPWMGLSLRFGGFVVSRTPDGCKVYRFSRQEDWQARLGYDWKSRADTTVMDRVRDHVLTVACARVQEYGFDPMNPVDNHGTMPLAEMLLNWYKRESNKRLIVLGEFVFDVCHNDFAIRVRRESELVDEPIEVTMENWLFSHNFDEMMSGLSYRLRSVGDDTERDRMLEVYLAINQYASDHRSLPAVTTPLMLRFLVVSAGIPGVWRKMDEGTRRYGDVLIGYYGRGLNTTQLGEELGIGRDAAGVYLRRGLERLWNLVGKQASDLPFDLATEFPLGQLDATRVENQGAIGRTRRGNSEWGRRTANERWYPTSGQASAPEQ